MDAVTAIQLSKATLRNIKENLFWALFYNSLGIPLLRRILLPAGLEAQPHVRCGRYELELCICSIQRLAPEIFSVLSSPRRPQEL